MSIKNIMIIAGEASGDHHGAILVSEIAQQMPDIKFSGIGGVAMQDAGVKLLANLAQYGVVGISEVLQHATVIYAAWRRVQRMLDEQRPDLLILIDYPGFNLRLAKYAKKLNIKVLYYISPQIWAWKKWRMKAIQVSVDHMAVILPFETAIYRQAGVPVTYVGNPLLAQVKARVSATESRAALGLKSDSRVITLMPGSRKKEISRMLPLMIDASELLAKKYTDLEFVLPLASSLTLEDIKPYLANTHLAIKVVAGQAYESLNCSVLDGAAMVTSGTATLETALMQVPMVILYKMSALTYVVGKLLVKIDNIGLCNILANKRIVPELIQHEANPANLAHQIERYLSDSDYRQQVMADLQNVRTILQRNGSEDSMPSVVKRLLV